MVQRVLLGSKSSGEIGLYISKPGINVTTATGRNFLFNSDTFQAMQFLQTGAASVPVNTTVRIAVPNMGYYPMVFLSFLYAGNTDPGNSIDIQVGYDNNSSFLIRRGSADSGDSTSNTFNYAVIRGQVMP